jgi:hypothetical protein
VTSLALEQGWLPGARYTNLRDIRGYSRIGLIDIDWKNYDYGRHLAAVKQTNPILTCARDIEDIDAIDSIIREAEQLSRYCGRVILVPKDIRLSSSIRSFIPLRYVIGYSVPTKYGGTQIPITSFEGDIHLLGPVRS